MNQPVESRKYFDLHLRGLGYLSRVRDVTTRGNGRSKAKPFLACSISAFHGDPNIENGIVYLPLDLIVSGEKAKEAVRSIMDDANDPDVKVLVAFRSGDHYIRTFERTGNRAGETALSSRDACSSSPGSRSTARKSGVTKATTPKRVPMPHVKPSTVNRQHWNNPTSTAYPEPKRWTTVVRPSGRVRTFRKPGMRHRVRTAIRRCAVMAVETPAGPPPATGKRGHRLLRRYSPLRAGTPFSRPAIAPVFHSDNPIAAESRCRFRPSSPGSTAALLRRAVCDGPIVLSADMGLAVHPLPGVMRDSPDGQ